MAGSCVHGNQPSGFIKDRNFLSKTKLLVVSEEGVCFLEYVIYESILQYRLHDLVGHCNSDYRVNERIDTDSGVIKFGRLLAHPTYTAWSVDGGN